MRHVYVGQSLNRVEIVVFQVEESKGDKLDMSYLLQHCLSTVTFYVILHIPAESF